MQSCDYSPHRQAFLVPTNAPPTQKAQIAVGTSPHSQKRVVRCNCWDSLEFLNLVRQMIAKYFQFSLHHLSCSTPNQIDKYRHNLSYGCSNRIKPALVSRFFQAYSAPRLTSERVHTRASCLRKCLGVDWRTAVVVRPACDAGEPVFVNRTQNVRIGQRNQNDGLCWRLRGK